MIFLVALILVTGFANAVIDNRYVPIYPRVYRRTPEKPSVGFIAPLFMTAHNARSCNGEDIPIQGLYREYNLANVNRAMLTVGLNNPLMLTEWYNFSELIFDNTSHLQAQGFSFGYEQSLGCHFSIGGYGALLATSSTLLFRPSQKLNRNLSIFEGDNRFIGRELGVERAFYNVDSVLCLNAGEVTEIGLSDIELYVRYGITRDYWLRCRRVDFGIRLGMITATGKERNILQPASLPFGGNGHVGLFIQQDAEFELKQDIIIGWWVQLLGRFTKVQPQRFIVNGEPFNYGVLAGRADVKPGLTLGVSPYIAMLDIQDGFGARLMYTYVNHFQDTINSLGITCPTTTVQPDIAAMRAASGWTNEYGTVELFYDMTATPKHRPYAPRFFAQLWAPIRIFGAQNVVRTWQHASQRYQAA
ncbi:hypothetical protein M1466_01465, partial [Candidatus Dependentiae bacterium]|nr:hypothetical protein [Candidatus Dependentiae bacterium]